MEDIVSADGLHMNDLSYACVANRLADSLIEATESESHPGVGANQLDVRVDHK